MHSQINKIISLTTLIDSYSRKAAETQEAYTVKRKCSIPNIEGTENH